MPYTASALTILVLAIASLLIMPTFSDAEVRLPDVSVLKTRNPTSSALIESRVVKARREHRTLTPRRLWVSLDRISPLLQRAVLIAEDASFYDHGGFDWDGIRAAAKYNLEEGKLARGGSTITQQLAKNLYLSGEKTLLRKANEMLITLSLEQHLTKKRILELYLNFAEWGDGIYGAEAAAHHHFGKPAAQLTKQEAALLAAILPAPLKHDPLILTPQIVKRQKWILSWMDKSNGTSADERPAASPHP
jgi:monofunctional biosynthetic peptidoglycan transglycosylase